MSSLLRWNECTAAVELRARAVCSCYVSSATGCRRLASTSSSEQVLPLGPLQYLEPMRRTKSSFVPRLSPLCSSGQPLSLSLRKNKYMNKSSTCLPWLRVRLCLAARLPHAAAATFTSPSATTAAASAVVARPYRRKRPLEFVYRGVLSARRLTRPPPRLLPAR